MKLKGQLINEFSMARNSEAYRKRVKFEPTIGIQELNKKFCKTFHNFNMRKHMFYICEMHVRIVAYIKYTDIQAVIKIDRIPITFSNK